MNKVSEYFRESWELTRANPGAFVGGTAILVVISILTLFLLFPMLLSGLEGMYLRARQGRIVNAGDVFMHRKKFLQLLGAFVLIGLDIMVSVAIFFILGSGLISILAMLLILLAGKVSGLGPLVNSILTMAWMLFVLCFIICICYREGRYLHALNFVSERGSGVFESLRKSRVSIKNRWGAAFLAFLYLVASEMIFLSTTGLPLFIVALVLFPLVAGATAISFAHEVGDPEKAINEPMG